ncbi:uncharacterized protein B0H18DRAFT_887126, partial [Fomitopsis serialis]|uniref:uncharacterized protein n=1 Tax=Fomitopsis serialis TaxID=139415 RepID=UPI002008368B
EVIDTEPGQSSYNNRFREMAYEDMRSLPILNATLQEPLRMHSPIRSIRRYVRSGLPAPPSLAALLEDNVYVVPKSHTALASPALSQLDALIWKDANVRDPSRWFSAAGFAVQEYNESSRVDFGFGLVSKGTDSPCLPFEWGAGKEVRECE